MNRSNNDTRRIEYARIRKELKKSGRKVSRQRIYQMVNNALSICRICREKAVSGGLCERHKSQNRVYMRVILGLDGYSLAGVSYDDRIAYKAVRKKISKLYSNGHTSTDLAEQFGCRPSTIIAIVRENGIEIRRTGPMEKLQK